MRLAQKAKPISSVLHKKITLSKPVQSTLLGLIGGGFMLIAGAAFEKSETAQEVVEVKTADRFSAQDAARYFVIQNAKNDIRTEWLQALTDELCGRGAGPDLCARDRIAEIGAIQDAYCAVHPEWRPCGDPVEIAAH